MEKITEMCNRCAADFRSKGFELVLMAGLYEDRCTLVNRDMFKVKLWKESKHP